MQRATATELKSLYRQLLAHAKVFPSIKRDAIVADIRSGTRSSRRGGTLRKLSLVSRSWLPRSAPSPPAACGAEFREKASETDPAKVAHAIDVAARGLETLRKYTSGLKKTSSTWRLDMDQDPLGAADYHQRRAMRMSAELAESKAAAAAAKKLASKVE